MLNSVASSVRLAPAPSGAAAIARGPAPSAAISVFAVEDSAVQIAWRFLPAPSVVFEIGDRSVEAMASPPLIRQRRGRRPVASSLPPGAAGGPGAVSVEGLRPGTGYDLTVRGPGLPRRLVERVTTLTPPPGKLLDIFATCNDMHLVEPGFGTAQEIEESWPLVDGVPYSWRCVEAAIDEAKAWGARALVLKGDMTAHGVPAEFHELGAMLRRGQLPAMAVFGNHEFHSLGTDGQEILAGYGVRVAREPWACDRPGIRLLFGQSARSGTRSGSIDDHQRARLVELASEAPGPVFVMLHHQAQRWAVPTEYPPGIDGRQARALFDELAAVKPNTIVASGHTHRHRRRRHGPIEIVEAGSTKDYPGTWNGYAVYEGGIRQVVRRIARPDVIAWTEATRTAVLGIWGRWSVGRRDDRCFSLRWRS